MFRSEELASGCRALVPMEGEVTEALPFHWEARSCVAGASAGVWGNAKPETYVDDGEQGLKQAVRSLICNSAKLWPVVHFNARGAPPRQGGAQQESGTPPPHTARVRRRQQRGQACVPACAAQVCAPKTPASSTGGGCHVNAAAQELGAGVERVLPEASHPGVAAAPEGAQPLRARALRTRKCRLQWLYSKRKQLGTPTQQSRSTGSAPCLGGRAARPHQAEHASQGCVGGPRTSGPAGCCLAGAGNAVPGKPTQPSGRAQLRAPKSNWEALDEMPSRSDGWNESKCPGAPGRGE